MICVREETGVWKFCDLDLSFVGMLCGREKNIYHFILVAQNSFTSLPCSDFRFYDHKLLRIFHGPKVRRGGPWRDRQTNTLLVSGHRPITLSKVPRVGSYLIISF